MSDLAVAEVDFYQVMIENGKIMSTDLPSSMFSEHRHMLTIKKNTIIDKPISIVNKVSGREAANITETQYHITAEKNTQCTFLMQHSVDAGEPSHHRLDTMITAQENAQINFIKLISDAKQTVRDYTFRLSLEKNSQIHQSLFIFDADETRCDIQADLMAEGASVDLAGLFVHDKKQSSRHTIKINHHASHTGSNQFYKGILSDHAYGQFTGLIDVAQHAIGVVANQKNDNLLLSKYASMLSQPQLEIYSGDIQCSHGVTVGQLDADALFYLLSRGITHSQAMSILTSAFAQSVIAQVSLASLRQLIGCYLSCKLNELLMIEEA